MDHSYERSPEGYSLGLVPGVHSMYQTGSQFAHPQYVRGQAATGQAATGQAATYDEATQIRRSSTQPLYNFRIETDPAILFEAGTPPLSPTSSSNASTPREGKASIHGSHSLHRVTTAPAVLQRESLTATQHRLEINAGDHLELDNDDDHNQNVVPYEHVRILGSGAYGVVEMVRDTNTSSVYARKSFRNIPVRKIEDAKRELRNEVRIMRRLAAHHHIARVHASYTKGRELAIIIDPVADGGDLETFLQSYRDQGFQPFVNKRQAEKSYQNDVLMKAFGCLASALAFIHEHTIRHKDIKPKNILIHKGEVMYTDFGLSYDFEEIGRGTTTGIPEGFTKKYCAPEVAQKKSRNCKSDVFSLGCVFVDICLALANDASYDHTYGQPYHELVGSRTHGLSVPCAIFGPNDGELLGDIIRTMLSEDPTSRPSASTTAYMIAECASRSFFCSRCEEKHQST
jgi:hypothetical protein